MLQKMRDNTQTWVTKLIVGLICLAFAVWGLESLVMSGSGGGQKVAKVDGVPITQQQYYSALQTLENRMAQEHAPIDPTHLRDVVMKGLIKQEVLLGYVKENHMTISDKDVDGLIMTMPAFQTGGKFDRQRFLSLVRNAGITPLAFKDSLRDDILLSQMQKGIVDSAFITPKELHYFSSLEQQKRDFQWATLSLSDAEKQQKISDKEIAKYYKGHESDFMTQEMVSVDYVLLSAANLEKAERVSENDLNTAYQTYVSKQQENVKPEVAIILLKTDAKHSEKDQMKEARSLESQLKKGSDFGGLAKKYSTDTKSAENKGYLGHVTPGFYGAAFDKTVAGLAPSEVSSPVVTKFGVALIKRVDSGKATVKPLKEMRDVLVHRIQKQQAAQAFQDASQKLADISFEDSDLTQPAKKLHLTVKSTPFFSRHGGKGITANKHFIQAAFSDEVMINGNNSDVVQVSPTEVAVLHLNKTQPARQETLAEVTSKVELILKKEHALKAINLEASSIVKAMQGGKTEAQIGKAHDVKWQKASNSGRQQPSAPFLVTQKAFSLPHPGKSASVGSVALPSGDVTVIAVSKVVPGSGNLDGNRKNMVEQALSGNRGQVNYDDFVRGLHDKATIKVYPQSSEG